MKFIHVFKTKLLVTVLASLALIGGATAVFASSPTAQDIVHTITHSRPTATTSDTAGHKHTSKSHDNDTGNHATSCPGLPEVKDLAMKFALSADGTGDAVQAICALHQGTFKGTPTGNASVSSSRVFGFGEIDMLLTYAQFLASHDKANTAAKLTTSNARSYLAQALQGCGTTSLETCLKTNIPGFKPGAGDNEGTGHTNNQNSDHGHANGNGKPTSTPTPHH
jgi:hypothetical protein